MRSFEKWLEDTEIKPTYEERTPMEIAYEAGRREGIGAGSKVPCSDRVRPDADKKKKEIYGKRLLDITIGIDHLRHRNEYEKVKDNLDQAIALIFDAVDKVRA